MTNKAVKIRLYPNAEQKIKINKMIGSARFVYNKALAESIRLYTDEKKPSSLSTRSYFYHNDLLKNPEYSWLKEHNTKVIKQKLIDLTKAYQNMFDSIDGKRKGEKMNHPKFKKKGVNDSMRFPIDAISKYPIRGQNNNKLFLTKDLSNITYKCSKADKLYLLDNISNIRSLTITKTSALEYYASILIRSEDLSDKYRKNKIQPITDDVNEFVAIDFGIKSFGVVNNEKEIRIIENNKFYTKTQKKLKRKQRKQSRNDLKLKKLVEENKLDSVYTANRQKRKIGIAKIHDKTRKQKVDFIGRETSRIVNDNQVIFIEDLDVKGMMKNPDISKYIQELNLGEFRVKLTQKAKIHNRILIAVDRFYASSKICSCCGVKNKELTLSDRIWTCKSCGTKHDRDENATYNILTEGKRLLHIYLESLTLEELINIQGLESEQLFIKELITKKSIDAFGEGIT